MKPPIQPLTTHIDTLYGEIRQLIETAKTHAVSQVNQALVLTYWQIGKRVKIDLLEAGRAQYGAGVLKQLAQRLTHEYGSGFSYSSLTRMAKFYDYLPRQKIVATLSQQLSWSHFVEIIKIEEDVKREFYTSMCVSGRWSVRTLRERMDSMLFERTAISRQPEEALVSQSVTPSENRNAARFFEQFRFQLTQTKIEQRVTDCHPFDNLKHSTGFAFSKMEMRANEMLTRVKV